MSQNSAFVIDLDFNIFYFKFLEGGIFITQHASDYECNLGGQHIWVSTGGARVLG